MVPILLGTRVLYNVYTSCSVEWVPFDSLPFIPEYNYTVLIDTLINLSQLCRERMR